MTCDRFLRLPEVIERTSLSRRSIYRRMKDGTFPEQVVLSANTVAWRESEIVAWMAAPMEWRKAAPDLQPRRPGGIAGGIA